MRKQINSSPQFPLENGYPRPSTRHVLRLHTWYRTLGGHRKEIEGNKGFVLLYISSHSVLFTCRFSLFPRSRWLLIYPFFFHLRNTKRFEITPQQHIYTPVARFSSTSNAISPKLSAELQPPDPTISDNDKDDSPPKLGEGGMHREFDAMKEAVAGDQEVALKLEEDLGMVGLVSRLEKGLGSSVQFGMFF